MREGTCSECPRPRWARGLCSSHYAAWHRKQYGRKPGRPRQIICVGCGESAEVKKPTARFCSHACWVAWRYPRPGVALVHVGPAPSRTWEPVHASSGRLWVAGRCRRCSKPFVIVDQAEARYCSRRCLRADGKDRRRARVRSGGAEVVFRRRIFERDGWRCQLCGRSVNRRATAPHPKAPTLDHIVPVSEGGAHSASNVQCAHFLCNALKGAGVWGSGEQLRLVG